MPKRPLYVRAGWTVRDYVRRVYDLAGEDNIFFNAGGIAFNILLAVVPFVLMLLSGLGYLLDTPQADSSRVVWTVIERLMPPGASTADDAVHKLLEDIIKSRANVGLIGLFGFIWGSTRLFGSLRTVLAEVFDIYEDRGTIGSKLFDLKITVLALFLFAGYTLMSAYVAAATTRGVHFLSIVGLGGATMGRVESLIGQIVAFSFIVLMFFALYKSLPNRRIRWQAALLGGVVASLLFELAKRLFTGFLRNFNPGSLYTGTLYTLVIIVFWVYYAAVFFILGGEVAQVYELRRVKRMQHEAFDTFEEPVAMAQAD